MAAGEWRRLADLLREASEGGDVGRAVARVAARLLAADDVGLAVLSGEVPSVVGSSDRAVALLEREFTVGEGPSVVTVREGRPTLIEDLSAPAAGMPMLAVEAAAAGCTAAFAFPLRIGAGLVGVLTAYRAVQGPLDAIAHTDALILSAIAAVALLGDATGTGVGTDVTPGRGGTDLLSTDLVLGDVVHVAVGMVAEQLRIGVVEALVRLRASAFASDRPLRDVAAAVVARELLLER